MLHSSDSSEVKLEKRPLNIMMLISDMLQHVCALFRMVTAGSQAGVCIFLQYENMHNILDSLLNIAI